MKHLAFLLTIGLAAFAATSADAQAIKGGFSGTLFTATAVAPDSSSVDIYVTPSGTKVRKFILTQVCVEDRKDVEFTGSSMGKIILANDCTTFTPGLAIPAGETLTFTETAANGNMSVMITGVLSKK